MNKALYQNFLVLTLVTMITACASSTAGKTSTQTTQKKETKKLIIGNIPPGSPFSKLKLKMSIKQVHDLIGEATDTHHYVTGKSFIPYYFGSDAHRLEELYKGQGKLTFTGSGIGGTNYRLYRIMYDKNEDGYK